MILENAVEMQGIVKVYPNGVVANEGVDFCIAKGEIHALVGENGAGKTTLMKILFGIEQPTSGTIRVHGQPVRIQSVAQALQLGLGMVQQHFMLVPSMTVAENILLGAEPVRGVLLDRREAQMVTRELAEKYSFDIDVNTRIEDLPVGDRQKVEILKVLYRKAQVIILDEPTAVLTPQETDELFRQLIILKEHGHTIVFISHKLREIQQICDRVTIMRKGTTVGTYSLRDITTEKISEYMMGREVHLEVDKAPAKPGAVRLRVSDLSYVNEENKKMLDNVSFALRSGEILGVVGVEGNGQKELVDIISGLTRPPVRFRDHEWPVHCGQKHCPDPAVVLCLYPPGTDDHRRCPELFHYGKPCVGGLSGPALPVRSAAQVEKTCGIRPGKDSGVSGQNGFGEYPDSDALRRQYPESGGGPGICRPSQGHCGGSAHPGH